MSVGRISGQLLKDNLTRKGSNLAFENDLLYLLVSDTTSTANHFVGIKNQNPAYPLDVTGTARATSLLGTTVTAGNLQLNGNSLSSTTGALDLSAATNNNLTLTTTGTGKVIINGVVFGAGDSTVWYVSDSVGVDTNAGHSEMNALRTIKYALTQANNGDTVYILPGNYQEDFPLVIPKGVSVRGAGLRETQIAPTVGTNNKDCFLLNGETTVSDLTVKDMFYSSGNNTGYAFRYASNSLGTSTTFTSITGTGVNAAGSFTNVPQKSTNGSGSNASFNITKTTGTNYTSVITVSLGANKGANYTVGNTVTLSGSYLGGVDGTNDLTFTISTAILSAAVQISTRSPYIQRITVLNKGSGANNTTDPYGYASGDAGRGVLIDGSKVTKGTVASGGSLEAAILFNECTFIVPNSRSLIMTNGARTEWLNCFSYFASLHVEGVVGIGGRGGTGETYLTLANKTGTYNIGDVLTLYSVFPTIVASGTIASISGSKIALTGNISTFKTNSNRENKVVSFGGNAKISNLQAKFGATSLLLDGTGDYVSLLSNSDFGYGPPSRSAKALTIGGNAVVSTAQAQFGGGSILFDGTGDHVTAASQADFAFGTGAFTLECWVYRTVGSTYQLLIDMRTAATDVSVAVAIDNLNRLYVYINGAIVIQGTSATSASTWAHIAVAKSGNNLRLFLNGVQEGPTYNDTNNYAARPVRVGLDYAGATGFTGYIDEVRISNSARYTGTFSVPTSEFIHDVNSVLLIHGNSTITDDGGPNQGGDFTVELWYYPVSLATFAVLIDQRTAAPDNTVYIDVTPAGAIRYVVGALSITSTTTITINNWHHIAVSRSTGTTRLFVNGNLQASTLTDTTDYPPKPVKIGGDYPGNPYWANGYIDEVRITKGFARYTAGFSGSLPAAAFTSDLYTVCLLHFDGANNATNTIDDGITIQDIRVTSGGTATGITRHDTSEFGAEMRAISGAFIYGNQGIRADGEGVSLQLMAWNFAYIGTGADLSNDKSAVVQGNEVIQVNGGEVFYNSVDQSGNYRIGNLFTVNYESGAVSFAAGALDVSSLNSLTFSDGTNVTTIGPTGLVANNLIVSGSTISSTVGQITIDPATNEILLVNADTTVSGLLTTGSATGISVGTPTLGTLSGAVTMTTATNVTNGIAQLNQVLTLLTPAAPTAFPGGSSLSINTTTARIMNLAAGSQVLNGTGITAPAAGTIVRVRRSTTFSTVTISATGPGTQGLLTVNRNGTAAVTKTLTYGNTTQTITATITGTTLNSNVVAFTPPTVGVLVPGYLITTAASGAFGGLSNSTAYYITAVTATTITLSLYNTTTGAIGAAFNGTSTTTGSLSFTSTSDNGSIVNNNTTLTISNNVAFPVGTPGFHETIDVAVSGTSVPAGWNTVQITHSGAGSTTIGATTTNTGIWYYDNSSTVTPTFASQSFAIGTSSLTYSSTVPHYNSSTTFNPSFTLTWNAGQTGHSATSDNIITTAQVGPFTSAGNESYTALGYTTLPTTLTVTNGVGPNASSFAVNIVTGFGAWTTTTTVPVFTADNSYTTGTSSLPALNAIILYKTGTTSSTTFIDETNIFFNSAVGGSTTPGGLRCQNPDTGTGTNTPAYTAGSTAFNSQTGTLYVTDAILAGTGTGTHAIAHNVINYSTGYLPAGPNFSTRTAANPQYFTFRFVRTAVSKFNITYATTTGVAKIYCAMPGANGTSLKSGHVNSWLDLGIDNSLAGGCALGGNHNPASTGTISLNCSFGTLSSTNATNNEIWIRIRLNQNQSITALYLGASTV